VREQLSLARLVTITGPGGSGKTRLALEIASRCEAEFAEVAWCGLEAATEPAHVLETVAAALGLSLAPDRGSLEVLTERLL